jgi:hypothetical protein
MLLYTRDPDTSEADSIAGFELQNPFGQLVPTRGTTVPRLAYYLHILDYTSVV